jgi:hypothetical protein
MISVSRGGHPAATVGTFSGIDYRANARPTYVFAPQVGHLRQCFGHAEQLCHRRRPTTPGAGEAEQPDTVRHVRDIAQLTARGQTLDQEGPGAVIVGRPRAGRPRKVSA